MRKVNKDYTQIPQDLEKESCKEKIEEVLKEGNKHKFSNYFYAAESVKITLNAIYHKKCAYCESNIDAGASLEVEHFRPKNKVQETEHTGYYWLAYEWSNLLLACEKCNGKSHKSNKFPIEGVRVEQPIFENGNLITHIESDYFLAEKALLLNPEIDDVEKLFIFKPDGTIKGLNNRAEKSIEIYGLDRESLKIARKKIIDDYATKLRSYFDDIKSEKISKDTFQYSTQNLMRELENKKNNPAEPYSRLYFFMFNKFDIFFSKLIPSEFHNLLQKIYSKYGSA